MSDLCPCGQGEYSQCCQPLHIGAKKAETAQQLMRSRYSAFAKTEIDYLQHTTAKGQQSALDLVAIREWSEANTWQKLEIVDHNEKVDKTHAMVEFKAYYHDGQQAQTHHERSYFVKFDDAWYFLDPTLDQVFTMKQPCICGSGKKFKQCCAQFL